MSQKSGYELKRLESSSEGRQRRCWRNIRW